MSDVSAGGIAGWSGASFELRLGAEFCAYMLAGEFAGLSTGAVSMIQLQAPEIVDDLVVEFESGDRWAIQAKAGKLQVSWKESSPFAKALLQLYEGARKGQVDTSPRSSDRLELAFEEEKAASSVKAFGSWLDKSRRHSSWKGFADSCASKEEKGYLEGLHHLLKVDPDDGMLAFLKKVYLRKIRNYEEQRQILRGMLLNSGIVQPSSADGLLDVLLSTIQQAAPYRGQIRYNDLLNAASKADISINGIFSSTSFRVFEDPSEESLIDALDLSPVHPGFIRRPELDAISTMKGILVLGKKGSGKSRALIHLIRREIPTVIILKGFMEGDVGRLLQRTEILKRRNRGPYQIIWDDIQGKPDLFADVVEKLRERKDDIGILCACRSEHFDEIENQLGESFWRRERITRRVVLHDFNENQSLEITDAVKDALSLEMDEAARISFAEHVLKGDGGPLFAVSIGQLIMQNTGKKIKAADIKGLPEELLDTWKSLYKNLSDKPHMQSLLHVMRFLYDIRCPQDERICKLLYVQVLGLRTEEYRQSVQALQGLWMKREGSMLSSHDVSMESIPEDIDRFQEMVSFALSEEKQDDFSMGILSRCLSAFFQNMIPYASQKAEIEYLSRLSADLGAKAIERFRRVHNVGQLADAQVISSSAMTYSIALETTRESRAEKLQKAIEYIEEAIKIYRDLGLQADVAMSLNNASSFYSDLAGLETTRESRAEKLQKAIEYIEEAIKIRRDLGLQADVAMSLNNASNRYSDLAGLETTRESRAEKLQKAIEYIEEAIKIRRDLGLLADVAMSLGTASICFRNMSEAAEIQEIRLELMKKALEYIEEALDRFQKLGLAKYEVRALTNAVITHIALGELENIDFIRAKAICSKGMALAEEMEDNDRASFFKQAMQILDNTSGN
jgi:tetratricopeptide (TPR) repeat protein